MNPVRHTKGDLGTRIVVQAALLVMALLALLILWQARQAITPEPAYHDYQTAVVQ